MQQIKSIAQRSHGWIPTPVPPAEVDIRFVMREDDYEVKKNGNKHC